jgi:hypothetical protein
MWINTLESASVALGSLAVIIGTLAALFKWLSRKITSVIEHELKRDLSEITRHTAQLIPNGGTHLADQITRLEISQAKTCTEIQAVAKAFTEHLADHRAK